MNLYVWFQVKNKNMFLLFLFLNRVSLSWPKYQRVQHPRERLLVLPHQRSLYLLPLREHQPPLHQTVAPLKKARKVVKQTNLLLMLTLNRKLQKLLQSKYGSFTGCNVFVDCIRYTTTLMSSRTNGRAFLCINDDDGSVFG